MPILAPDSGQAVTIYGGYTDSGDQTFSVGVSKAVTFDTNLESFGIEHSESVDNSEFTFTTGGVYQATIEPHYTRTSGGGTTVLNLFAARDTGSGFVTIPNSNVRFAINTANVEEVSPTTSTFRVDAGDKLRIMIQVEDANLELMAVAASGSSPNDIPLTASIRANVIRVGN